MNTAYQYKYIFIVMFVNEWQCKHVNDEDKKEPFVSISHSDEFIHAISPRKTNTATIGWKQFEVFSYSVKTI